MLGLPRREGAVSRASRWSRPALLALPVVLAAFLAAGLILRMYSERSGWSSVSTAIGDYRRLPLADGSTLELNTASKVRYRLSENVRELDLTAGEARFRVAHYRDRPFVVVAGDTVIRAVGTEFTVRIRDDGKVDVVVSEGVVAVSHRVRDGVVRELIYGRQAAPRKGGTAVAEGRMLKDSGGRFAFVEMTRHQLEAHDAWRNNMLVFDETPLKDIVEEFNRYNRRKLVIVDPLIGGVAVGGRYRPRDVEGFLQNLSKVMKIRVVGSADSGSNTLQIYSAAPLSVGR